MVETATERTEGERRSLIERLAELEPEAARGFLARLPDAVVAEMFRDWDTTWAHPGQRWPSGAWDAWVLKAGRGYGKTEAGARATIRFARENPTYLQMGEEVPMRLGLVAPTNKDVRGTMMEGASGLLNACRMSGFGIEYVPARAMFRFENGVLGFTYSAETSERLRGPQHGFVWIDELCAMGALIKFVLDQVRFGNRLGSHPRIMVTTTPKPHPEFKKLLRDAGTMVTGGRSAENLRNLSAAFQRQVIDPLRGTTLGRQELDAEVLEDVQGALLTRGVFETARVLAAPDLAEIVVGVDPAASSGEDAAETGIIVAGATAEFIASKGASGDAYVLEDLSLRASPDGWSSAARDGYHGNNADYVVAEANNGGEMVEHTIQVKDGRIPVKMVWASRGKRTRAEPVTALYEQGRLHHVGRFPELEEQWVTWVPGDGSMPSPDRLDAEVWALTALARWGDDEKKPRVKRIEVRRPQLRQTIRAI